MRLLALGLMSGTSMDGIDAALITTDGVTIDNFGPSLTHPYSPELRAELHSILGGQNPHKINKIERDLTLAHANIVTNLLKEHHIDASKIDVIGFHGHTILHNPEQRKTWQIGDGALLASQLSIPVIGDFRSHDVAQGGQGAPLVPVFHRALAESLAKPIAILNLGGVGNVTWIGADNALLAFDTGPGNALIDDWAMIHTGNPIDDKGQLALKGQVNQDLLARFSEHPYFQVKPPKSLDRNDFRLFAAGLVKELNAADGAATLTYFTARAVRLALPYFPKPVTQWLVCGGGRHNPALMKALRTELDSLVEPVEVAGWNGDALEAQAFAYLAVRSLKGLPLTYPETTSCPEPLTGGRYFAPKALSDSLV